MLIVWALAQLFKADNTYISISQLSFQVFRSLFEKCTQDNSVYKETAFWKKKERKKEKETYCNKLSLSLKISIFSEACIYASWTFIAFLELLLQKIVSR